MIISRIKIMSKLDISDEDFHKMDEYRSILEKKKYLRVSTLPSSFGERVV